MTTMTSVRSVVTSGLLVIACLAAGCVGGGGGDAASAAAPAGPAADPTSDFFHLAVVPNQVVTSGTYEVQVISENIDATSPPGAPTLIDADGNTQAMTAKTLTWPGTVENSVTLYAGTVTLKPNQKNTLQVTAGTNPAITFDVYHKSALSVLTANNATELATHVKTAIATASVDVVELNYDEPDLGAALNNVGNGIANARSTWLTVQPATGKTATWIRNTGAPANYRPKTDLLHLNNVTFGSDTSDQAAGQFYPELNQRIWLSNVTFRAKYKASWLKTAAMTATAITDVRMVSADGTKIYFTDCSWDGTATTVATTGVELARDLRFNSHRGDFNNFGKVFLNAMAFDSVYVTAFGGADTLHNDGFQIWGSASDIAFKGLRVKKLTVDIEMQPFLLDRTNIPNYSKVLVDGIAIENAAAGTSLKAQVAGVMANSRLSNFSFPGQGMTIRQDFVGASEAFAPTNVRIHNLSVKQVEYYKVGSSTTYTSATVATPADISSVLNAQAGLAGASFSSIALN